MPFPFLKMLLKVQYKSLDVKALHNLHPMAILLIISKSQMKIFYCKFNGAKP